MREGEGERGGWGGIYIEWGRFYVLGLMFSLCFFRDNKVERKIYIERESERIII